jgi:uncharacterized protein (TIGR02679 family)
MSVQDPQRLLALLGTPEWRWWRERARASLEDGRALPAVVTLRLPSPEQRLAANRLFSRPGQQGPLQVDHAQLLQLLQEACIADDLEACLEALDGPLRNRRLEQAQEAQAWSLLGEQAASRMDALLPAAGQRLRLCLDNGWVRRCSAQDLTVGAQLLEQAVAVLTLLLQGKILSLATLSAAATGDAHALDRDRALGRIALLVAGAATPEPGILAWRAGWASLGVETDAVSASVLVLNLRATGEGAASRLLNAAADAGEPLRLTSRLMSRDTSWGLAPCAGVSICENPSVVAAAAARLGARSLPLVCVDGQPSSPALLLLATLLQSGRPCRYHGDFDWPGLSIARELTRRFSLSPWRFTAQDLLLAGRLPGPPLEGAALDTPWDPPLRDALVARGRALHEEAVIEDLLADLGQA